MQRLVPPPHGLLVYSGSSPACMNLQSPRGRESTLRTVPLVPFLNVSLSLFPVVGKVTVIKLLRYVTSYFFK
jgi:hypothetical protein